MLHCILLDPHNDDLEDCIMWLFTRSMNDFRATLYPYELIDKLILKYFRIVNLYTYFIKVQLGSKFVFKIALCCHSST